MADKSEEVGCLWVKDGSRGPYMTGKIGEMAVVAFKNDNKKNLKEPDWRILKARPRADVQAPPVTPDAYAPFQDADDSIPFAWLVPFLLPLALVGASVLC